MTALLQDIRYGWRGLRKSPGFAAIAILTLALGIGANTAIFTVVDALLLKPLPYANPSRLVLIHAHNMRNPNGEGPFSLARFEQLRDNARAFSGVAVFTNDTFDLTGRGEPRQLDAARVSWNFFNVLGVEPVLGRGFTAEEGQLGGTRVVILSHDFWMREFGGASNVIGQSLDLDSLSYTIVGVLPASFAFQPLGSVQPIWIPREFEMNIATLAHIQRGMGYLVGVARPAPGITLDQARAEMAVLDKEYVRDNAGKADADAKRPVTADSLSAAVVANLRPVVLVLMGAVGVVLLIACANVASLLLARSLKRKKEIAVRTALGAARGVIIRQLLIESLLLALLGAAAGIATGYAGVRALLALDPSGTAQMAAIQMDWRVLLFALAIAIFSGLLFGLAPALQVSKTDLTQALREEGRSATGSRRSAMSQNALVVAQVALSMILLIGCGLLIRSFVQMVRLDPGFDASRVVTMEINLPPSKYATPAQMVAFYNEILRQTSSLPGVEAAEISSALPLNRTHMGQILAEGQPVVPLPQRPVIALQTISPDYAKVLRVPLIRGREFTAEDNQTVPTVAMVNQAFVREFWPNVNPLGRHVWIGSLASPVEVVGVYGDVKNLGLTAETIPELFMPYPNLP
ncbi:MAG: ABC transporter permease, partial [Candidatus Acidiferrales bacterium]